jgi:hypothetical protein
MLKGVHLTLLIGPAVPVPAPAMVVDSLSGVQVNHDKDRSGFQLTFNVSKNSLLLNVMLPAGYFDPMITRVIIIATLNGFPHVLMDGIVTRQAMAPSSEVGQSTLTITGEDLSIAMDVVEKILPYPAMPIVAKIYAILAPYAALGVVPLVIPPFIDIPDSVTTRWETQTGTDRAFIKQLAQLVGYVFFVMPGPLPGQSIAYFGPDINVPVPQPALTINMDAHTNVESLSFALDGLAKNITILSILDPITGKVVVPIPLPNINAFKPPLGARPTAPAKVIFDKEGSKFTPAKAAQKILGHLMNNSSAVSATGSLDVLRFGNVLKSRLLVGVRGAGLAYDGMYYVDSVTHDIKPGEYKQNFTLSRDGLISNTPVVLP